MLKSFCIKSNNQKILNYLQNTFKQNCPNNFCMSQNSFKNYNNVIFHYTGNSEELYIDYISDILRYAVIYYYENKLIKNIINYNYFYFSDKEKKLIFNLCVDYLAEDNNSDSESRKNIVFFLCKEYIKENKAVILDGFVNFRLKEYINFLDSIVETCVNSYIIQKEYVQFIDLLKKYIKTNSTSNQTIHLIYLNQESILLDNEKNVIQLNTDITDAKYLSDITFSSNDYCLNTLLNLLPKKIYIHLLDNKEDEFITTLKSIFEKRICFCTNCEMCNIYKIQNKIKRN